MESKKTVFGDKAKTIIEEDKEIKEEPVKFDEKIISEETKNKAAKAFDKAFKTPVNRPEKKKGKGVSKGVTPKPNKSNSRLEEKEVDIKDCPDKVKIAAKKFDKLINSGDISGYRIIIKIMPNCVKYCIEFDLGNKKKQKFIMAV